MNALAPLAPPRTFCRDCRHYGKPGYWSAHCLLGSPEWAWKDDTLVRADNTCARWEARADLADAAGSGELGRAA